MEKRGVISEGITPPEQGARPKDTEKQGADHEKDESLADSPVTRLQKEAEAKIRSKKDRA